MGLLPLLQRAQRAHLVISARSSLEKNTGLSEKTLEVGDAAVAGKVVGWLKLGGGEGGRKLRG